MLLFYMIAIRFHCTQRIFWYRSIHSPILSIVTIRVIRWWCLLFLMMWYIGLNKTGQDEYYFSVSAFVTCG